MYTCTVVITVSQAAQLTQVNVVVAIVLQNGTIPVLKIVVLYLASDTQVNLSLFCQSLAQYGLGYSRDQICSVQRSIHFPAVGGKILNALYVVLTIHNWLLLGSI